MLNGYFIAKCTVGDEDKLTNEKGLYKPLANKKGGWNVNTNREWFWEGI